MKIRFFKFSVLLPIIIGLFIGAILFWTGYSEDGPGSCVVGLAVFFGLALLALWNAGVVKFGLLAPILLFCYAVGIIALDIRLFLEGEFDNVKILIAIIGAAVMMISVGVVLLVRRKFPQNHKND